MPTGISNNRSGPAERMGELGAQLRSLREAQGHTYEDVTRATHVRPFVLQAIEEGRALEVADAVYARGFVKNYCEYLYANDLWNKYKDLFGVPESLVSVRSQGVPSPSGINHPTPIFRRASMLWVYLILILAVAGAVGLLWWQQKESGTSGFPDFFVQSSTAARSGAPEETGGEPVGDTASGDAAQSPDLPVAVYLTPSGDVASADRRGISADVISPSVDLSWMDGSAAPAVRSAETRVAPARTDTGDGLFIEIVGAAGCRLEVLRNGVILTRRSLRSGDVRSYDVTSFDVEARFSNGSAARVEWRGAVYDRIGERNAPVRFLFSPSGAMRLIRGQSRYGQ